jgi:ubiquinone/menaquinone biosynthesis C-methylase UbiE
VFHPEGPTPWELARQALSSTERGYDLLAPKFDFTPFRTPDELIEPFVHYIERTGRPGPERALDLCSGTGAVLEALSSISRTAPVGLDFSQGMLRQARLRGVSSPLVRARAEQPPFQNCFDLVTCAGALGHFRERERELVSSVRQMLVPGGRFVFLTARRPQRLSMAFVVSSMFNAAMHVRNALWKPPFVMFYLTLLLDEAAALLGAGGFEVSAADTEMPPPFERTVIVDARKKGSVSLQVESS